MRRILGLIVTVLVLICLTVSASAATSASKVESFMTVTADGSCQVTTTVTVHLEQADGSLSYPVPGEASDVTLNGARARTKWQDGALQVDLSGAFGGVTGDISFTLNYTLRGCVGKNDIGTMELRLPLMSGFAYPVDDMRFSVTLPGEITALPAFSSGYYQASIEKYLTYERNGATLTGSATQQLKDRETLSMTLPVEAEMFHSVSLPMERTVLDEMIMGVCAAAALSYWLIFLRAPIPRKKPAVSAPAGYSAGQLGSLLTLQGCDLSTMVLSWAQLGYVHLHYSRGRVMIRHRMDMGNERSSFEQKCFRRLFSRRQTVDTAGMFYTNLCTELQKSYADAAALIKNKHANPKIFRALAALIALSSGVGVGLSIGMGGFLQGFWMVVFAIVGAVLGWVMQRWACCLLQRDRRDAYMALAAAILWIAFGMLAGEVLTAGLAVLAELIAGYLLAIGGRRTQTGRIVLEQTLGFRSYLRKMPAEQIRTACQSDPEYFFKMAPWALAMGVDGTFAKRFGGQKLPPCPYLSTDKELSFTASQWSLFLRQVLMVMDRRRRQMPMERLRKRMAGSRR